MPRPCTRAIEIRPICWPPITPSVTISAMIGQREMELFMDFPFFA
jgi:hypothetical protein